MVSSSHETQSIRAFKTEKKFKFFIKILYALLCGKYNKREVDYIGNLKERCHSEL